MQSIIEIEFNNLISKTKKSETIESLLLSKNNTINKSTDQSKSIPNKIESNNQRIEKLETVISQISD